MNGGTGFHHKAVKGEPAGGHFNSSVNTMRSHLCRLSKQHIADPLKGGDGYFLERPAGFLRTPLTVPTGFWTRSLSDSEYRVQSNHRGDSNRDIRKQDWGLLQQKRSWDNGDQTAVDIAQRAKQLLLHSVRQFILPWVYSVIT